MGGMCYLGSNNKMTMTIRETVAYLEELDSLTARLPRDALRLFFIPSFTALPAASACAGRIELGAQNMCWEERGQFTGEISPLMLQEVGVSIVEIGHSERRHIFGETDKMANRKLLCALAHGFTPLLCVGETGEQKACGVADETLRIQLIRGLQGVGAADAPRLAVAYEPVWAIGAGGTPADPEYAREKHAVLRRTLRELFGAAGEKIPLLYGGSVNLENCAPLARLPEVDGLFIGRSAWKPAEFYRIIQTVLPVFQNKRPEFDN